ncbi:hypothetical protein [Virgibacillus halodenitrificans]|uniref:hypothetical protein n=1 Tax=Virgibacillus halodenitrificans TaxID=1482 RepID=UPI00045C6F25|nr:hypothetical protein [Virgibacillus halodenitrificans]CDQ31394.1 hypothetical protein BN993_00771 [Virgibacillus halodenitrificans]
MKIYVKNDDGKTYEAFQVDKNTYTFKTENKTFELSLTEAEAPYNLLALSEKQMKAITKEIFTNMEILEQLKDAKRHRDKNFSYYSGDEAEFNKLVDEMNSDR